MSDNYINIYNNLINLTRNKLLYKNLNINESFSVRLVFFLIHFAFFLKQFKKNINKEILQELYDFNFRQLEISIREIGYGDVSINKKMKDYLNLFHKIIGEIDLWDEYDDKKKALFFKNFLEDNSDNAFFIDYFDNFVKKLKNITFISFTNDIIDFKI